MVIEVKNLRYEYTNNVALQNVSFSIKPNTITALVGPNGAGKTTLLRCLSALHHPYSGSVNINGFDTQGNPRDVHSNIGYLSDFFGVYEDLTVEQCLTYIAWSRNVEHSIVANKVAEVIESLKLTKHAQKKASELSRGLRQRLGIGQSIIHNPSILLLDEPASGLDPEARLTLSQVLCTLRDQGMTIIVSSHILAELEEYCDSMIVIRGGKMIEHTTVEHISTSMVKIELLANDDTHLETVLSAPNVTAVTSKDNTLTCTVEGDKGNQNKLLNYLVKKNLPICGFTPHVHSFKDRYLELADETA
jgi:ABC-2 type transport system ATP-binding protein